jgi:hypothetical protein
LIDVLFFSEEERREALEDHEKAKEAGIISEDQVKWFTPEETQKVAVCILDTGRFLIPIGIRRILHDV